MEVQGYNNEHVIFIVFIAPDGQVSNKISVQDVHGARSVRNTEELPLDVFLAKVGEEWDMDIPRHYAESGEAVDWC